MVLVKVTLDYNMSPDYSLERATSPLPAKEEEQALSSGFITLQDANPMVGIFEKVLIGRCCDAIITSYACLAQGFQALRKDTEY